MFIILTHENQSMLLPFSLFLSFATNSNVAEKNLSGSTDVRLIVIKAWYSFSRLFDLYFVTSKRLIFFFTIYDLVVWFSLSLATWILCFDFKWFIKLSVLDTLFFL